MIVRERGGNSVPALFSSESKAAAFIRQRIANGTTVHADEANAWDHLHERFEVKRINHQGAYSLDGACTNQAEEYFSRLRRGEIDIHHHIAGPYLLRYAQESSWREDNRRVSNGDQVNRIAALALKRGNRLLAAASRLRDQAEISLGGRAALVIISMRDWPAAIDAAFARTSNVPATVSSSTTNNPQSLSSWNSACSSNVLLLISVNSRFLRSSKLTENSKSMATPVQLHPKIRVRPKARLSAAALAEFIITTPDKQDDVLHDARFMRSPPVSHYADAIRSIKAYCEDPRRDHGILDAAAAALKAKSESKDFKPSQQEDAKRCIEVITRFSESLNAFGARSASLLQAPSFDLCNINGVLVSVQPDLLVATAFPPPEREAIGAVFIRPQKAPDPDACKTDETKLVRQEYRVEVARYMLVLGWLNFVNYGLQEGQIDTKKMSVWDIRLKEAVPFPSDRVSRIRRIEAACGQIVRLWDTVEARPGDYAKKD